jgi:2-methylisocitrate lyase-like PEP mutase family enzyme
MAKLQDMFTLARRAQSGGGIGFLGKSKAETKARAAALVFELLQATAGSAEAAIKAGADGLLFNWNGKDQALLETIKQEIDSAKTSNENVVSGLRITDGWDKLDRESINALKESGIQYVVLPLNAPARLLTIASKEVEIIVTVPMRSGDMYPLFIRNLTAFESIAGVLLDFNLASEVGSLSIEDALQYRAVREAVRFPALLNIRGDLDEAEAYTVMSLGVQALVLSGRSVDDDIRGQIKNLRELLEKVYQDEKDSSLPHK